MSADSGSAFTLFIENGLHAGSVQRLAPGIYTLGSELEADIILSDKDIEAVHLLIELDQRSLRLEPLQGAIVIDGESTALEPGGERHLSFPGSFAIGDAKIRITAPKDAVRTRKRTRAALVAASIAIAAVLGFQIVQPLGSGEGPAVRADLQAPTAEPPSPEPGHRPEGLAEAPADGGVAGPLPGVSLDQAAKALRQRLARDGFSDIEVKTATDRLMVRGEAEPARMGAWQDIRIWFDGAFGRDVLLVANVEPAERQIPPKLAIEAIWAGDDPYLIAGGQRFMVGAHIGDGWTIERIGAEEITFKRGDKVFSLTL